MATQKNGYNPTPIAVMLVMEMAWKAAGYQDNAERWNAPHWSRQAESLWTSTRRALENAGIPENEVSSYAVMFKEQYEGMLDTLRSSRGVKDDRPV